MAKTIDPNESATGTLKMTNSITKIDIPASYSNIVFTSNNVAVFGLNPSSPPDTMDFIPTGLGKAVLTVGADCTYLSPQTGENVTIRKVKAIPITVAPLEVGFSITFE